MMVRNYDICSILKSVEAHAQSVERGFPVRELRNSCLGICCCSVIIDLAQHVTKEKLLFYIVFVLYKVQKRFLLLCPSSVSCQFIFSLFSRLDIRLFRS